MWSGRIVLVAMDVGDTGVDDVGYELVAVLAEGCISTRCGT